MDFLVLNELTLPFQNPNLIEEGIKNFISTFAKAKNIGFNQLRIHKDFGVNLYSIELVKGLPLSKWLHSHREMPINDIKNGNPSIYDLEDRFREIITYSPLIGDDDPIAKEENDRSIFEIEINGKKTEASGLGSAYLLGTISISFLSGHLLWDSHEIKGLIHYYLNEDGSDSTHIRVVPHISRPVHIEKHLSWLEEARIKNLQSSRELWERRKEFFPHLELCDNIQDQLTNRYGVQSGYFRQLIDRLKQLDVFAGNWKSGGFNPHVLKKYGLTVSGESPQTLAKYCRERKFRLPDGRNKVFEMHIKTGDLRFHFFPDIESHRIYVGYIGPHLRTISG